MTDPDLTDGSTTGDDFSDLVGPDESFTDLDDAVTGTLLPPDFGIAPAAEDHAIPDEGSLGDVKGDPDDYEPRRFDQMYNGSCSEAAITQIIEVITGTELEDESTVLNWTVAQGLNQFDGYEDANQDGVPEPKYTGLGADEVSQTLDHFGVPNHIEHGSIARLEQLMAQGHEVLVGVDADDLWGQADPDDKANHAVTVAGIDREAIAADGTQGVVYLSDTGVPFGDSSVQWDGHLNPVPLHTFEDAWNTVDDGSGSGDHVMIVTEGVDPEAPADSPDAPVPGMEHDGGTGGWVILPMAAAGLAAAVGVSRTAASASDSPIRLGELDEGRAGEVIDTVATEGGGGDSGSTGDAEGPDRRDPGGQA